MSLYYPKPEEIKIPSLSEVATLHRLANSAYSHESGGTYDMVAYWIKGSHLIAGYNRLDRPAMTIHDDYPDILGVHAELDLYRRAKSLKGGTVFIAGKINKSGSRMRNTRPCAYCSVILHECGVKNVVYYNNGSPAKASVSDLIGE